jgi:hypothetical protein
MFALLALNWAWQLGRIFLNERSLNVNENKGSLWETCGRSRNVFENTGTYPVEPGMS